jgi:hypothetical protein
VVPADVVLEPGQGAAFKVRAFDAHGRFLREVKSEWSLPSPPPPMGSTTAPPPLRGQISDGKLTLSKEVPWQQGAVLAKVGSLTGRARVRVVHPLPFEVDFAKVPVGRTPAGWVNCQGKYAVVEKAGARLLKKLNTNPNPLLARARAYMGMPNLTDYTVQADLMGTRAGSDMPDMGLIANRYTLLLDGNKQQLKLVSWSALPRVDETIQFEWKPDVWYTMKLTIAVEGNKAVVRGKVWPRGQSEPGRWTIEFTDPTPNKEGSPALYGYSTGILDTQPGSEVFFAKVSVTPNSKK